MPCLGSYDGPFIARDRYDAIRTWNKLLTSPDSEYWVQLSPGTAIGSIVPLLTSVFLLTCFPVTVINNHRILHGRSAFDGRRRMCGAYIGVDEYRSKLFVLSEKFARDVASTSRVGDIGADATGRSVWSSAL